MMIICLALPTQTFIEDNSSYVFCVSELACANLIELALLKDARVYY